MFGIDLTNEEIPASVTQRLLVVFEVTVLTMLAVMERVRLTPPGRGSTVSATDRSV
ncbi:hypothetical protein ACFQX6_56875 [Streptosporangium lutulentum]